VVVRRSLIGALQGLAEPFRRVGDSGFAVYSICGDSISSMGEDMLMAHALNALTTKAVSKTTKETLAALQWDSGGVVMGNSQFVP
jgi:hypothetical protein